MHDQMTTEENLKIFSVLNPRARNQEGMTGYFTVSTKFYFKLGKTVKLVFLMY